MRYGTVNFYTLALRAPKPNTFILNRTICSLVPYFLAATFQSQFILLIKRRAGRGNRYFDNCQASSGSAGCKSNRFLKSNEVVSHQVLNPRLNKATTAPRFLQKSEWRVEQQGSSAQEREPFWVQVLDLFGSVRQSSA